MSAIRMPPPGYTYGFGADGQLYLMPIPQSADSALARTHGLGAAPPQDRSHPTYRGQGLEDDPMWDNFEKIPTWYRIEIELGGESGDAQGGSVPLRPEPFVAKRVTWATTADTATYQEDTNAAGGSQQGRAVTIEWMDEFTKFIGSNPILVSALFGDSQGYLDLQRGLLFQGKQALSARLTRLFWPGSTELQDTTIWHIVFHGIALLPRGVHQSGSAG